MTGGMRLLSGLRPAVLILIIAIYMADTDRDLPFMALLTFSGGFFIVSSALVVNWIPAPATWLRMALWLEIALCSLLNWQGGSRMAGPMPIVFLPPVVSVFLVMARREWPWVLVALGGGWLASSWPQWAISSPAAAWTSAGIYGALLVFGCATGLLIRSLFEAQAQSQALLKQVQAAQHALDRTHRQLIDSLAQQQETAVLAERQRLAREIHDGVAHALTALVVQIQAGRRLLDRSPAEAVAIIARCEELARGALQETRQAVRALHPAGLEAQSEFEALRKLGRDFGAATGIEVTVTADAAALALPPDPHRLEQIYRIFQEALTNAHRHGHARQVSAELQCSGGALHMIIHNDGEAPRSLEPGVGLKAMAERARSLGGELALDPSNGGFTIRVTLPVRQEAAP